MRFYLTNTAAAQTGAGFAVGWTVTAGSVLRALSPSRLGANTSVSQTETATTSNYYALGRWCSAAFTQRGPLPAQTAVLLHGRWQSDYAMVATLIYNLTIRKADNSIRYTLANAFGINANAPTPLTEGYAISVPAALTCEVGDYVVVELGFQAGNTVATSYTSGMYYGGTDASAELAVGDGAGPISTRPPWLDLDTGLLLATPLTTPWCSTATAGTGRQGLEAAWGADLTLPSHRWIWSLVPDVQVADGAQVVLRVGALDESSATQPAQLTARLRNQAGLYSQGPQSPLYPAITQGTPIRQRLDPGDGQGSVVQFVGKSVSWQPAWDDSGRSAWVLLTAAGVLRQRGQGSAAVLSPLRRANIARLYVSSPSTSGDVVAYWPMEDANGALQLVNLAPGGLPMTISGVPDLASSSDFVSSDPMVTMVGNATLRGSAPTAQHQTNATTVRWLMTVGGLPSADVVVLRIGTLGSVVRWDISVQTSGAILISAYDASGAQVLNSSLGFNVGSSSRRWQLVLSTSGSTITWTLWSLDQGAKDGSQITATLSGTVRATASVALCPNGAGDFATIGHVAVHRQAIAVGADQDAYNGYDGELADARITALMAAEGLPLELLGSSAVAMGARSRGTLLALLREIEATDKGLLYDGCSDGLSYVTGATINGQTSPAWTLNAASGDFLSPEPVADDQERRNVVTATRVRGSDATYTATGLMAPGEIGEYEDGVTVNVSDDAEVLDHAGWEVRRGTVEGYRYPGVSIELHRARVPAVARAFIRSWLSCRPGSRIDLANISSVRSQHPAGTVRQLLRGWEERFTQFTHHADLNLTSFEARPVAVYGDAAGTIGDAAFVLRGDSDGSTLAAAAAAGATSISVATPSGPLWTRAAGDFPLSIELGGRQVVVSAVTGTSSPQTFTVAALAAAAPAGAVVQLWRPPVPGV